MTECDHGVWGWKRLDPFDPISILSRNRLTVVSLRPWWDLFRKRPIIMCYDCRLRDTDPHSALWGHVDVIPLWARKIRRKRGWS